MESTRDEARARPSVPSTTQHLSTTLCNRIVLYLFYVAGVLGIELTCDAVRPTQKRTTYTTCVYCVALAVRWRPMLNTIKREIMYNTHFLKVWAPKRFTKMLNNVLNVHANSLTLSMLECRVNIWTGSMLDVFHSPWNIYTYNSTTNLFLPLSDVFVSRENSCWLPLLLLLFTVNSVFVFAMATAAAAVLCASWLSVLALCSSHSFICKVFLSSSCTKMSWGAVFFPRPEQHWWRQTTHFSRLSFYPYFIRVCQFKNNRKMNLIWPCQDLSRHR